MSRQSYKKSMQIRVSFSLHRYLRIRAFNERKTIGKLIAESFSGKEIIHRDFIEGMYD